MRDRLQLPRPALLLALGALLVADSLLWSRSFGKAANFDEGGYTVALEALREGQELGTEVFLVQPPLFYNLLQAIGAVVGPSFDELRAGMLVVSLAGVAGAFVLGRAFGGDWAGVGAATLYSLTPPFPANAPLIEADPPSVSLALIALAFAAHGYGRGRHGALAFLAGVALAASVLVKLFTVTAFAPLLALALWKHATWRQLLLTAAGGVALTVATVLPHLGALPELWEGVVGGHLDQREIDAPSHLDNVGRLLDFVDPRTPVTYLLLAGVAAYLWRRPAGVWALWAWTGAATAFTIAMRPLLDHHLVLLAAALSVPAGISLGAAIDSQPARVRAIAVGLAVAVAAAGGAQQYRQAVRNNVGEAPRTLWAAGVIERETKPGERIVTDIPTVAVLADRRVPGYLVDVSWGRVRSGALNRENVIATIEREGIDAVVVGRMLRVSPGLAEALRARFPDRRRFNGITIYLR